MEKANESFGGFSPRGNFTDGIPFYGDRGNFNFTMGRSRYTPGIAIKQLPLTSMARETGHAPSEFDAKLDIFRHFFKPGDRIRGVLVNSTMQDKDGKEVVGKIQNIKPDRSSGRIRVWIKDPKTLKVKEVYADTIERIYEAMSSSIMSFSEFIRS